MSYRLSRRALLMASSLLALPAGGSVAADKDTIVVSQASDVLTLDPMLDTSPISFNVFRNIFDALTRVEADGSVGPLLAQSWTPSAEATVWEFTIRSGAKFHNGQPVTAQDVVWSYQRLERETKSPVRTYISKVKSIEAVESNKVRFTLSEPYAPFDRQVSLISIVPRKAFEEMGAAQFALTPVGAGPFKVVAWKKDDRVELEAFAEYWGGAPKIRKLIFRPVPSESARAAALASGELDVVPILPPALVDNLGSRPGISVQRVASNKVVYLGFDVNNPLLSDIRVRKAIDMAVDRNAISQRLLRGLGKPSGQVIAPVTFGYAADINPTAFDAKQAKEMLAQTSYRGERIVLQYPTNNLAFGQEVAQAIANYLANIGINVELQGMEYSAFFPLWANRKLNGLHLFAYGPSIMDADLVLGSLYEKTGRLYWIDPQVQDLIQKQRAEADPARRRAIIGEILKLSARNLPYAPLYNEIHAYGIQNRVKWLPRPDERLYFQSAEIQ